MTTTTDGTLDAAVAEQMARWAVPGVALGIYRDGAVETRAWGVASLRSGERLRPDALFRVASISKVFTATLIMALVDDGLLDLDAPVSRYLPDLRLTEAGTQDVVTLQMLLSHGSGQLGDYFVDHGLGEDSSAKAITQFRTLRLLTPPGETWAYCNSGFHVAGRVVEVVTGKLFDQVMRERVFEPLGLERSCFWAHEMIAWPHALGHNQLRPDTDEHVVAPQYYPRFRFPAGGVVSSAPDLLQFAAFHMGDGMVNGKPILSETSLRAMQEPQRQAACWADAWGIGWDIRWTTDGSKVIAHGGSINGYRCQLTLVPERRFAVAIMTNGSRGSALNKRVERWLLERELGLRFPERERITLDPGALARFAGSYRQGETDVTAVVDGDGLRLDQVGPWEAGGRVAYPPTPGAPIAPTEFLITAGESEGARFDFLLRDDGAPRYLRLGGRLYDRV